MALTNDRTRRFAPAGFHNNNNNNNDKNNNNYYYYYNKEVLGALYSSLNALTTIYI